MRISKAYWFELCVCICVYVCTHVCVHMHVGMRVQQWYLSLPLSNLYFETESLIEHGGHRWAGMAKQQAWASCCLSEPRHPDVLGASPLGSQRTQVSCCLCHPAPHLLHPTTPVTRVSVSSGMQMSQHTPSPHTTGVSVSSGILLSQMCAFGAAVGMGSGNTNAGLCLCRRHLT